MTEDDVDDVMGIFLAAFPDAPLPNSTLLLWRRMLSRFPHEVGQAAALSLLETRHPTKHGKFPTVDEFTPIADRIWNDQHTQRRSESYRVEQQTAKLLSGPVEAWGENDSLPATAVRLVRDLCEGTVKPGSEEHARRQAEVERMARVAVSPCCDVDGLVSYQVVKDGRRYTYAARCACPKGLNSRYQGFPVYETGK